MSRYQKNPCYFCQQPSIYQIRLASDPNVVVANLCVDCFVKLKKVSK